MIARVFYVTIAANQPKGAGYYEVLALTEERAQERALSVLGRNWSMLYASLDEVHPFDREKKHGTF